MFFWPLVTGSLSISSTFWSYVTVIDGVYDTCQSFSKFLNITDTITWTGETYVIFSPAKQKQDIGIAFPGAFAA